MNATHTPIRALTADHIGQRVVFADGGTTVDGILTDVWVTSRLLFSTKIRETTKTRETSCNQIKVETPSGVFELKSPSLDFEVQFPGADDPEAASQFSQQNQKEEH